MIFNLVGLQTRQTGSSIRTKVLLRAMLLDTTAHQEVLVKQALSLFQSYGASYGFWCSRFNESSGASFWRGEHGKVWEAVL